MDSKEPKASKINNDLIVYRLDEIKEKLARFESNYVTKEESAALRYEIGELRLEIADIKRSRNLIGWLYPTASAAFSAVFTYLLIKYIDRG
jgi:hypothetical protein